MEMLKNKWFWIVVAVVIVIYISMVKKKGPLASLFSSADSFAGPRDKSNIKPGNMSPARPCQRYRDKGKNDPTSFVKSKPKPAIL